MAKIRIVDAEELPWMGPGQPLDQYEADEAAIEADLAETDDPSTAAARLHHPGSETDLQLLEVRLPPNDVVESHAHRSDEIIYVLEGELRLGARVLRAGASIGVPGNTLYGFRVGDQGVRYLNFRATKDMSFISKDEFVARRQGRGVIEDDNES